MSAITIPDFALVVLIGASGAGKSTFAARLFGETEIVSSDRCRALVSDSQDDQSVSADAFALARTIAEARLKHRRLTVIDATNVSPGERKPWVEIARRYHAMPVAIRLDPGLETCIARNAARPMRGIGPEVPTRMAAEIRRTAGNLAREGFRRVWMLDSAETIAAARIEREPLQVDRRGDTGPFDVIGDVHGCIDELETLLARLGYLVRWQGSGEARSADVSAPHGRKVVFAGDLVDRGPATPDVLRLAMAMEAGGIGFAVQGNHDEKLGRWLEGRSVSMGPGLRAATEQFAHESTAFRQAARDYLAGLPSHLWLDGGRLAVAHAGLKAAMLGRDSPAVSAFTRYGETDGTIDADGLPVRRDWMSAYDGPAMIAYGHTPMAAPLQVGRTICLDTGCVFGGRLTALRWPEQEIVGVPAARTYFEPVRPLA